MACYKLLKSKWMGRIPTREKMMAAIAVAIVIIIVQHTSVNISTFFSHSIKWIRWGTLNVRICELFMCVYKLINGRRDIGNLQTKETNTIFQRRRLLHHFEMIFGPNAARLHKFYTSHCLATAAVAQKPPLFIRLCLSPHQSDYCRKMEIYSLLKCNSHRLLSLLFVDLHENTN